MKPLNPRDSFYGGRTGNTVKLSTCKNGEKIKYLDVCSLYPYINKISSYPIGHPTLYVGVKECERFLDNIGQVSGLIKCDILPPQRLYHPVLPVKMHNKLLFPLCRSCAELLSQDECEHRDEDRMLHGVWVSPEILKAVEMGYVVKRIYEVYHYKMTQFDPVTGKGGLFSGYINKFFVEKTHASGYPPECVTVEDKDKYVSLLEKHEGIKLDKSKIAYNPGLRSVAKLCLNSMWGRWGMRPNLVKTEVVTDPTRLSNLLEKPDVEVNGILPVNDEVLYVNWSETDDAHRSSPVANVVIAAYTTALARLKLYSYLEKLGSRVIYYDTDSVFFVSSSEDDDPPTGAMMGDLTDELSSEGVGTYITSFVSGGPKFYAYKFIRPDGSEGTVIKIKGIRLNFENSEKVSFESIVSMVKEDGNIEFESSVIRRTRNHDVVSMREKKVCKPVYTKRRFEGFSKSYPYGYKKLKAEKIPDESRECGEYSSE